MCGRARRLWEQLRRGGKKHITHNANTRRETTREETTLAAALCAVMPPNQRVNSVGHGNALPEASRHPKAQHRKAGCQARTERGTRGCPASAAAMRPLPSFSLSLQRFTDRRPHLEKARTKTRTKREPPDQHHQTSPVPHPASNFPCFQNHETLALFCCFLPPWASHGTSSTTFFDAAAAAFSPQQNPLHVHFADRRPCLMPAVYRNRSH
ncbi:hypothetical protein CABS03_02837 [Colletotrichum abscissum]|uniref:Uncharacterized protein n=1 Tax=Colletotrichum abscissum TaxID=1671311 RepID=A0A9P9XKC0_9PEZI|nr:hypothetical protein CABS02_04454 [Colletotrichum abscissum]